MHFDTVIFAGGGNRCFWQAGFWHALAPALARPPARLLGVSAGAMVACGSQAGVMEPYLDHNRRVFDANRSNFDLAELLRGRNPFPHPRIVREGIERVFDADAMDRLRGGIPVHVLASVLPARVPSPLSSSAVQAAYVVERWAGRRLHGDWGLRLGFRPHWHAVARCETAAALGEVLLASSAIPPASGSSVWRASA